MPNETYCNVIATVDGIITDNILFIGDTISKPIGGAAEEKALELFKGYVDISEYDEDDINVYLEDGYFSSKDGSIKVFITWPVVQNPSK